jgi:hypothetical protein
MANGVSSENKKGSRPEWQKPILKVLVGAVILVLTVAAARGRVFSSYFEAIESVQVKVDELRRAEQENTRLRLENAQLRLRAESLSFDCQIEQSRDLTQKYGNDLHEKTGSTVGRTLASIQYRAPTHLLPEQLYTLGVSYFKGNEDEKAAVILTLLTQMSKGTTYRTARNYVMSGVAWYRLHNYEMAGLQWEQALRTEETPENLAFQAQARLWKAVLAKKTGRESQVQQWLEELVDHHPHSPEVGWVNSTHTTERTPASEETKSSHEHGKEHEHSAHH